MGWTVSIRSRVSSHASRLDAPTVRRHRERPVDSTVIIGAVCDGTDLFADVRKGRASHFLARVYTDDGVVRVRRVTIEPAETHIVRLVGNAAVGWAVARCDCISWATRHIACAHIRVAEVALHCRTGSNPR